MPFSLSQLATNLEDYPQLKEHPGRLGKVCIRLTMWTALRSSIIPNCPRKSSSIVNSTMSTSAMTTVDKHTKQLWTTYGCQSLQDYHNLYLLTDTLLLADVSENFHIICLDTYQLDPAHCYTVPGLACDVIVIARNWTLPLELFRTNFTMFPQAIG